MTTNDKPTLFSPGVGMRGMTEAHFAAYCGHYDALVSAIAEIQDINVRDTYRGYTPLHWLCDMAAAGGPRLEMLRLLVEAGADVSLRSNDGLTPLALAKAAGTKMGDALASAIRKRGAMT